MMGQGGYGLYTQQIWANCSHQTAGWSPQKCGLEKGIPPKNMPETIQVWEL